MTSDRKKPGVEFWATIVVVVVLVGYPLSFGPACWIVIKVKPAAWVQESLSFIYWPINQIVLFGPEPIRRILTWYASFWL